MPPLSPRHAPRRADKAGLAAAVGRGLAGALAGGAGVSALIFLLTTVGGGRRAMPSTGHAVREGWKG